nr:hypothetical protein [Bacillus sp. 123MFChir2]
MNTGAEYGFGVIRDGISTTFTNPLINGAITTNVLAGITGSASGGMDTLPHNGAVITLLAVTGLTHKQSYRDIFAITIIKTATVFVVIGMYSLTGLV